MLIYKVWFHDSENMKNYSIKVKATGIIPAIEEAIRSMLVKTNSKSLSWEVWKAELY